MWFGCSYKELWQFYWRLLRCQSDPQVITRLENLWCWVTPWWYPTIPGVSMDLEGFLFKFFTDSTRFNFGDWRYGSLKSIRISHVTAWHVDDKKSITPMFGVRFERLMTLWKAYLILHVIEEALAYISICWRCNMATNRWLKFWSLFRRVQVLYWVVSY